jgi:hypothetical protein
LLNLLRRWRAEAEKEGRRITRIAVAFEAGHDGFWLARWLAAQGVETHVIHPLSSVPSTVSTLGVMENPWRERRSSHADHDVGIVKFGKAPRLWRVMRIARLAGYGLCRVGLAISDAVSSAN